MKVRFLLALLALSIVSCTKDVDDNNLSLSGADNGPAKVIYNAQDAAPGVLTIKFKESAVNMIEAKRSDAVSTRSGIESLDEVFAMAGVENIERVFPYSPKFEDLHRQYGLHQWYTVSFDVSVAPEKVVEALRKNSNIAVLEYCVKLENLDKTPAIPYKNDVARLAKLAQTQSTMPMNDPKLNEQWHYANDGKLITKSVAGADVNLFPAWAKCAGDPSITVAVIDMPVQYSHVDIADNMWVNEAEKNGKPGVDDDGNGYIDDIYGYNFYNKSAEYDWRYEQYANGKYEYADHGTHVAGTVAAVSNNGVGVSGIAGGDGSKNGVKIMSCQILGDPNKYAQSDRNPDAKAFVYAADNGAVIAQCSYGMTFKTTPDEATWVAFDGGLARAAIDYFIQTAGTHDPNSPIIGGVVFFAAGNEGDYIKDKRTWPCSYDNVVCVASTGPDFRPAYYTNYGTYADVSAPGGDFLNSNTFSNQPIDVLSCFDSQILSLIQFDPTMSYKDGRTQDTAYGWMQGTSMACPHVSGAAALALSYAKKLGRTFTADQFKELVESSTNNIDSYFVGYKGYFSYSTSGNPWLNLNLPDYVGKMGSGQIDITKMLAAVEKGGTAPGSPRIVFTGSPRFMAPKGEGGKIDFSVNDPSGSTVTVTINDPNEVLTLTDKGSGKYSAELKSGYSLEAGTYKATVTATNAEGLRMIRVIYYTINIAPQISNKIPNVTMKSKSSSTRDIVLGAFFKETSDDSMTYVYKVEQSANGVVDIVDQTKAHFTIYPRNAGVAKFTVTATDRWGVSTTQVFTVTVRDKIASSGGWL